MLILMSGSDSLLVVSRSMFGGRQAGWITAAGTMVGNATHAALAAAGVSAVIAASPALFDGLRLAGAGYLAWLGVKALRDAYRAWRSGAGSPLPAIPPVTGRRALAHAFLTDLLNPKVVLFYRAFVPQFVAPALGAVALQTFTLGMVLALLAVPYHLALGALAARAARRVVGSPRFRAALDGVAGLLFLGFAVRLFLTERRFA